MVNQPILDRLVCAKYLFEHSTDVLVEAKPYAAGMAVLNLQDAAEMVLRAIAEHLHASVAETTPFNKLIDDIDKQGLGTLSHRTALNQLNKARVNFKHVGLEPRVEHVRKFRADMADFFVQACQTFLQLDFQRLSLTGLVAHSRARNWLERAEQALREERFEDCVNAAAVALHVFQRYWSIGSDEPNLWKVNLRVDASSLEVMSLAREVGETLSDQLERVHRKLELVAQGVSYNDFRRFDDSTPTVQLSYAGTLHLMRFRHADADYDDGLFCLRFARDLILKVQGTYRGRRFAPRPGKERYRLTRAADLIVHPTKDGTAEEVIERALEGAQYDSYGASNKEPGYTALFYQDECVYIASDAVEAMPATT